MSKIRERLVAKGSFMVCDFCVHDEKHSNDPPCCECLRGEGAREMFDPNVHDDVAAETDRCAKVCEDAVVKYKAIARNCQAQGNFAEANEWVVAIDCAISLAQEIRGEK